MYFLNTLDVQWKGKNRFCKMDSNFTVLRPMFFDLQKTMSTWTMNHIDWYWRYNHFTQCLTKSLQKMVCSSWGSTLSHHIIYLKHISNETEVNYKRYAEFLTFSVVSWPYRQWCFAKVAFFVNSQLYLTTFLPHMYCSTWTFKEDKCKH